MKTKIAVKSLEVIAYEQLLPFVGKPLVLMISGGSILRVLESEQIAGMDKSLWSVYFADERLVPAGDKDSNYGAAEKFLDGVGNVFPIDTSLPAERMLAEYKEKLLNAKFDLAFLGIGEDGHIASIFPESAVIDSSDIVTIIRDSPKPPAERVTVTPRMLTMIKKIVFLIPRLSNGMIKAIDEPHFSILSRINTDLLIVTIDPLS
ncbi:6-phosphogluconolactonase [Nematocida homosporus]|uniref:6-phosphogluconolactonase n=1 Tax=Nematocida homosporus TaxID=1912981 RepID=UPI00221E57D3|nr:6-phosphogluconolactonase [Nematocida homosporus]KAI5187524.1 6-phosphogluconolactonase [Nematocida homosporus]